MQLNTFTLNHSLPPTTSTSQLAVYDNNLAIINSKVFVYGKNLQNYSLQTPLHQINLITFKVEPVFTVNAPAFSQLMMFSFQQHIFFLGKTSLSSDHELYDFDDNKFTKLDQSGPVPPLNGSFSFTKFSHRYLLVFNCLNGIQFLNKWYLLDIKQRQWKQIVSAVQLPVSENSHIIWQNGKGYLLLSNCYDKTTQKFHKNLFYQIQFSNFTQFHLRISQIHLPSHIKSIDAIFTNIFTIDDRRLIILGGQQICVSQKKEQILSQISAMDHSTQIDFKNTKIIFEFDLETFQWSHQSKTILIKGQYHQMFTFDAKLYTIGGVFGDSSLKEIKFYDLKHLQNRKQFTYEQSLCYYCECAFTYEQSLIYEPAIEAENETFTPRNRVENKFLRKLAQSITTEIHAIGILCEFLFDKKCHQTQINLCEEFKLHSRDLSIKQRIEYEASQILAIKGLTNYGISLNKLIEAVTDDQETSKSESFFISMAKIKLASFKLGYGILFVTSSQEGHLYVSFSSHSQTDFPQSNFKSFSEIYYIMKWNKTLKNYECSSDNKRNIIFQNVKMHFGSPQIYENVEQSKKTKQHLFRIYVIGVNNLEKALCIEPPKSKFIEDIKVKSLNKKNSTNSLRKYLKHFYLTESLGFKLTLQNVEVEFVNVYDKFEEFAKIKQVKEISTNDEGWVKKAENEETHFSTNQDEVISWKKIETIEHCKLYEVSKRERSSMANIYQQIFVYHSKKLLKTFHTKKEAICGVIELKQSVQIQLNGGSFTHKQQQRKLLKWMEQIEHTIMEEGCSSMEEV